MIRKKLEKQGKLEEILENEEKYKNSSMQKKKEVFKEIHDMLGGKIKLLISGAAALDKTIEEKYRLLGLNLVQGYGLTETSPVVAVGTNKNYKLGSIGKTVPSVEAKLVDVDENGMGELIVKGPSIMIGHYEDEEATKAVVDEDGWFNSGDVGYLDKDGFLYITGRSKNVIVTQNGKNIYPEEIEMLLKKNLEIKECMVYGKAQENSKELTITARVIPNLIEIEQKYGKDSLTDEKVYDVIWKIIKETNKELTSYKAIKKLEIKKDDFEMTTTMKIKRYKELQKDKS